MTNAVHGIQKCMNLCSDSSIPDTWYCSTCINFYFIFVNLVCYMLKCFEAKMQCGLCGECIEFIKPISRKYIGTQMSIFT